MSDDREQQRAAPTRREVLSPRKLDYSQPSAWEETRGLHLPIGGWDDFDAWSDRAKLEAFGLNVQDPEARIVDSADAFEVAQGLISEGVALHGWQEGEVQPRTYLDLSIDLFCRALILYLDQREGEFGPLEQRLWTAAYNWRGYFAGLQDGTRLRETPLPGVSARWLKRSSTR